MTITCLECEYTWTHRQYTWTHRERTVPKFCSPSCEYKWTLRQQATERIARDRRNKFTSEYLNSLIINQPRT